MSRVLCPRCVALVESPRPGGPCPSCRSRGLLQTEPSPLEALPATEPDSDDRLDAVRELAEFDDETAEEARRFLLNGRAPHWHSALITGAALTFPGVGFLLLSPDFGILLLAAVLLIVWGIAIGLREFLQYHAFVEWADRRREARARLQSRVGPTSPAAPTPDEEVAALDRAWAEESRGRMKIDSYGRARPPGRRGALLLGLIPLVLFVGVTIPGLVGSPYSTQRDGHHEVLLAIYLILACFAGLVIYRAEVRVRRFAARVAQYQRRRAEIAARMLPADGSVSVPAAVHLLAQLDEEWRIQQQHFLRNGEPPEQARPTGTVVGWLGAGLTWCLCTSLLFVPVLKGEIPEREYVVFASMVFSIGIVAVLVGLGIWGLWYRRLRLYQRARLRYELRRREIRASVAYLPGLSSGDPDA